jgi:hypothetical protein
VQVFLGRHALHALAGAQLRELRQRQDELHAVDQEGEAIRPVPCAGRELQRRLRDLERDAVGVERAQELVLRRAHAQLVLGGIECAPSDLCRTKRDGATRRVERDEDAHGLLARGRWRRGMLVGPGSEDGKQRRTQGVHDQQFMKHLSGMLGRLAGRGDAGGFLTARTGSY